LKSSWERNRWVIISTFILEALAFYIVLPFIPLYVQELGVTDPAHIPLWSGLILGSAPLAVALMLPVWDHMAERTGRRFQVLRSLVGVVLGLLAMAASQTALHLLLAYLFEGVTAGFYPQMWTLVSTGAPAGGVGQAMGLLQGVDLLVTALGPLAGGLIADLVSLRAAYVLGAFFGAAALVVMWVGYKEDKADRVGESQERPQGVDIRRLTDVPGLFPLLALTFLSISLVPGVFPLVPLYLQSLVSPDAPVATLAGIALMLGNGAGALASVALGRMSRRWPARNLLAVSLVVGGVTTALVPSIPHIEVAFLLWIARSIATGGIIALMYGVADSRLPPQTAKGIYPNLTGAKTFGHAAGPLVTGAIAAIDLRGAFVVVGALLVLMGLWALRAFRRTGIGPNPEARLEAGGPGD
jgi:DHA1 family multidrug resistance protein-like MFS transporter